MNQRFYIRDAYNDKPSSSEFNLRRHLIDIDPIGSNEI